MLKCQSCSPHLGLRALHHLWQSRWSPWRWSRETPGHLPGGRGCLRAGRESSWISWTRLCNIGLWVNTQTVKTQLPQEDMEGKYLHDGRMIIACILVTWDTPRRLPGRPDSYWANFCLNEHKYQPEDSQGSPTTQTAIRKLSIDMLVI